MSVIPDSAVADPAVALSTDSAGTGKELRLIAEPGDLIHAAVQVLMARHKVSQEEAVDLLEHAVGDRKRPLSEVAKDVILLGLPSVRTQIELRPAPPVEAALTETVAAGLLDLLAEMTTLPALLQAISRLAVDVVPGCEAASVTVIREGAPVLVASDDRRARQIDETQCRHGEGPYLKAVHTHQAVRIDDISTVPDHEAWARVAERAGFRATLLVPVVTTMDVAAVISLYAQDAADWSPESLPAAETVADHAGNAIAIAYRLTCPIPAVAKLPPAARP